MTDHDDDVLRWLDSIMGKDEPIPMVTLRQCDKDGNTLREWKLKNVTVTRREPMTDHDELVKALNEYEPRFEERRVFDMFHPLRLEVRAFSRRCMKEESHDTFASFLETSSLRDDESARRWAHAFLSTFVGAPVRVLPWKPYTDDAQADGWTVSLPPALIAPR